MCCVFKHVDAPSAESGWFRQEKNTLSNDLSPAQMSVVVDPNCTSSS